MHYVMMCDRKPRATKCVKDRPTHFATEAQCPFTSSLHRPFVQTKRMQTHLFHDTQQLRLWVLTHYISISVFRRTQSFSLHLGLYVHFLHVSSREHACTFCHAVLRQHTVRPPCALCITVYKGARTLFH